MIITAVVWVVITLLLVFVAAIETIIWAALFVIGTVIFLTVIFIIDGIHKIIVWPVKKGLEMKKKRMEKKQNADKI